LKKGQNGTTQKSPLIVKKKLQNNFYLLKSTKNVIPFSSQKNLRERRQTPPDFFIFENPDFAKIQLIFSKKTRFFMIKKLKTRLIDKRDF
jgi:CMP-N-acetylneuraminic acid synthetase